MAGWQHQTNGSDDEFASKCVLVVEDDPHTQKMLQKVLRQVGVGRVIIVSNGREAIDVLKTASDEIDVAFLDLDMPVMNGMSCLKLIRKAPIKTISRTRVVILTAYAGMAQLRRTAELGISGFLSKPVSLKALSEALDKALAGNMVDADAVTRI